jgi:protein-S-isoprenylcysteine O-methyltransferase Ste14
MWSRCGIKNEECRSKGRAQIAKIQNQNDRGQKVIQSGPYQFVRHPGYLGGMITYLALPMALNSILGYIGAVLLIIALVIRTYFEDKTLQQELDGYRDYARKVLSKDTIPRRLETTVTTSSLLFVMN